MSDIDTNENVKLNLRILKITNGNALDEIEKNRYKGEYSYEVLPWADRTPYREIAEVVIKDKNGSWRTPLFFSVSHHQNTAGIKDVCVKASEYLKKLEKTNDMDVLSISAGMEEDKVVLKVLVRQYTGTFNFAGFFAYLGEEIVKRETEKEKTVEARLVIPEEVANFSYSEAEIKKHDTEYEKQKKILENCTEEKPFLNSIKDYVPQELPNPGDAIDFVYDLKTSDMQLNIVSNYDHFFDIFKEIMTCVNGTEYYRYIRCIKGDESIESFMTYLEKYVRTNYIATSILGIEDLKPMMDKLYRSLFQMYIIQDLIDDPDVTDIKITAPDSIRARIKGKAYITNINFIDDDDYLRFINMIAVRNRILQTEPEQTFTDNNDEHFILRITLTAAYTTSTNTPILTIRKINRVKLLHDDLIREGMFDEKIWNYLLDCGRHSRGVIFGGPPGSGKTIALNCFLEEAYEQSAEILVIQENDELFCYRKGVMFQHVVKGIGQDGRKPIDLEGLGQLALVAGANVFVIGETKGAEICSAITLSNSGCRTAMTLHCFSATEIPNKAADLAMRGYAKDFKQAKRQLTSFQTLVYLEKFKVKEIAEIIGYDEAKGDLIYRHIYRREEEKA